jgi:hypothetical protein
MMTCLTFLRDLLCTDVAMDSPLVAMHHCHPSVRWSAWSSYWLRRIIS